MLDDRLAVHVLAKGFELKRCLGRGSMGVVYVAHDRRLEREVALKTLLTTGPDELYRIKKEFRSLAGIVAPNLVRLHEMHAQGSDAFFTMDLIDGVPFNEAYATPVPSPRRLDVERLRDGLAQLVRGVATLHDNGRLHRDIKPTNVLVEENGRVVVVDFGLAHDLASNLSLQSQLGTTVGTLAYMAPEQAWGLPLTPAADWYSLGVLLYELLTGELPPSPLERSGARRHATKPLYPSTVDRDTPEDLDRLVFALLQEDPAARPSATEIAAALERTPGSSRRGAPQARGIVGREAELTSLGAAFDAAKGAFAMATVEGPSGIGKTALLRELVADLEHGSRALVLKATCHPRESLLFKAVDGIVDDLVRHLARDLPERVAALLPPDTEILARLFPVLGRLRAPASSVPLDPYETRQRAFAAFGEILRNVARRQRVVLWIDDLQWGDADSAALLQATFQPETAPCVLLLVSHRGEPPALVADLLQTLRAVADEPARVVLAPLAEGPATDLALRFLGDARRDESMQIARESAGDPLLIQELARFAAHAGRDATARITLAEVMAAKREALSDTARRLLEVMALAGEPVGEQVALAVPRIDVETRAAVVELVAERLLATSAIDELPALDLVHARIRESIAASMSAEARRSTHWELAKLLERHAEDRPERFVEHYALAGEPGLAADRAVAAAERATRALASHQACRLYETAIELTDRAQREGAAVRPGRTARWEILARLGDALVSNGKGGPGARQLHLAARELARSAPGDARVMQLTRRAAEQYMRSGQHTEGMALLRQVMDSARLRFPGTTANALASMLVHRARLGDPLELETSLSPRRLGAVERERLEVCWSAGASLSLFDLIRTGYFQAKHALMARDTGDVAHVSRAIAMSGLLLVWEGGARRVRRGRALLHAGQRLADRTGDPNIQALSLLTRAVAAYYEARYEDTVAMADRGERMCREACSSGGWELTQFQVVLLYALAQLGRFPRMRHELPRILREARARDDLFCIVTARLGLCNFGWVAADESARARAEVEDALAGPFPSTYTWQIYQGAYALAQIDLYDGRAAEAKARADAAWKQLGRKQMLRLIATRVEMLGVRARAALRLAAEDRAHRGAHLAFVDEAAASLRKEDADWVDPHVDALEAGALAVRGEHVGAARLFEHAALGFDHFKLAAHAAAARYQAARALGADATPAREALGGLGVAAPDTLANTLIPAFRSGHG